jgi:cytosine/adenosine deaminase-related metal-dependent hydrolase
MIVRARVLVPIHGPPIPDGALRVEGPIITAVAPAAELPPAPGEEVLDLSQHLVLPGLINAHCHLDYSMLRFAISPQRSFTQWIQRINALKRCLDTDDYLAAIRKGFAELQHWGTTTVCNIESFPELLPRISTPPVRTWWFYEMIDVRHRTATEAVVSGALSFFDQHDALLGGWGLSPHAPYTASRTLYELSNACSATHRMPLTTHLAESREEFTMFREAQGPLYEFLDRLQRPMTDCGHGLTPFATLWNSGCIDQRWILAHMNELTADDLQLLASAPRENLPSVVHCPGSHHYFGHSPFQFRALQKLGINLCTGTDSLASTDTLNLFQELRRLGESEPSLSPLDLLRTATLNPARALGMAGRLGEISPGAFADLIALPCPPNLPPTQAHAAVLECRSPVLWTMLHGKVTLNKAAHA